ncbi:nucleotide exchange factor GrpE [Peptoniphilus mikwangii]|uniref:nucleotide exchange factor GrpE n=1 Tax=Peptoniphilus mikwangii TaxID=1354300 RepID=UPI00042910FC|nr:nucleotide exchange factor GrpE [Peptoniphilus mikwangii]
MSDNKKVKEEVVEEVNETMEEPVDNSQEVTTEEDIDEIDSEVNLIKDQFLRLQADFANYKRRTEVERKEYIELGTKKVMLELIQIVDNFERAIESKGEKDTFFDGVELIYKQLMELLEKNGVTEMNSLNEKFDPNLHHAVLIEQKDGIEEGIVIEVLQKGYMIGEKVLRSAMVKVSK